MERVEEMPADAGRDIGSLRTGPEESEPLRRRPGLMDVVTLPSIDRRLTCKYQSVIMALLGLRSSSACTA
jgi:hypothetical protein